MFLKYLSGFHAGCSYCTPVGWDQRIKAVLLRKLFEVFPHILRIPPIPSGLSYHVTSQGRNYVLYRKRLTLRLKRRIHIYLYISTFCRRVFAFPPIIYYVLPGDVGSQSMEGRKLGLLAGQQESMVLERDYVAFLWLPSLAKLGCASSGNKSYSAWPKNG